MNKISKIIAGVILGLGLSSAKAQVETTEEIAAQLPIKQLFLGMRSSDSSLVKQAFAAGARLETVVKDKEGVVSVKNNPLSAFLVAIGSAPSGALDEHLMGMEIKIDGDMATAWTPYEFFYKGQFSHRGVNAFQLVKINDRWKIWSIIDTRRK